MSHRAKKAIYHGCKWVGGFRLARRLTRSRLRILVYHGFALADEHQFHPQLFMAPDLFQKRIDYLERNGYPVLPLGEAVERLASGRLPASATVITFDDGFYSTWKAAAPVLRRRRLPGTIYVTTYYSLKGSPIFRLVVQYMFWKTQAAELDLEGLAASGGGTVSLASPATRLKATWDIIGHGECLPEECERVRVCEELGRRLDVPYDPIVQGRFFTLMTPEEVDEAAREGWDIELHTHRHRLPTDPVGIWKEITDNQDALAGVLGTTPRHFCYPSGVFQAAHFAPLREAGILTATTCEPGLNTASTSPLALRRFTDSNNVSWIEFEAEMTGLADIVRMFRRFVPRRFRSPAGSEAGAAQPSG